MARHVTVQCTHCSKRFEVKGFVYDRRAAKVFFCSRACFYNSRSSGDRSLYTSEAWLRQRYLVEGKSGLAMAEEAGCSFDLIYDWLRKYDIPVRDGSEAALLSYSTTDRREERSIKQAEKWAEPEYRVQQMKVRTSEEWRQAHSERLHEAWQKPEYRESHARGLQKRWSDPEQLEAHRKLMRLRFANPEYVKHLRATAKKGNQRRWGGVRARLVPCSWCGELRLRSPSNIAVRTYVFCDRHCQAQWASVNRAGEQHPRWKGGGTVYYGPNWLRQQRAARQRDKYKCRICGKPQKDNDRALDVHHIRPFREWGYVAGENDHYKQANELSNLISLCRNCHGRAEAGKLSFQPNLI